MDQKKYPHFKHGNSSLVPTSDNLQKAHNRTDQLINHITELVKYNRYRRQLKNQKQVQCQADISKQILNQILS